MPGIRSLFSTTAIFVGAGAALLTGGIAKADPVAPAVPMPNVPGLSMIEQFIDPAKAPALLQAATSALTGVAATPAAPVTPPPVASALLTLPQAPTAPGATSVPTAVLPGMPGYIAPGTTTAPAAASSAVPVAEFNIPQVPGMPIPLPQTVSLPTELTAFVPGLTPSMTPAQAAAAVAGSPSAAAPSTAPALASIFPTNALP